jgi:hypothetical protein
MRHRVERFGPATPGTETTTMEMMVLDLAALMREHRVTIRQLADRMGITMKRVREVRATGWVNYLAYCEFVEAVTGVCVFDRARWDAMTR